MAGLRNTVNILLNNFPYGDKRLFYFHAQCSVYM